MGPHPSRTSHQHSLHSNGNRPANLRCDLAGNSFTGPIFAGVAYSLLAAYVLQAEKLADDRAVAAAAELSTVTAMGSDLYKFLDESEAKQSLDTLADDDLESMCDMVHAA